MWTDFKSRKKRFKWNVEEEERFKKEESRRGLNFEKRGGGLKRGREGSSLKGVKAKGVLNLE